MSNLKRSKSKFVPDAEIEQFCRGVEDILTQIKDRSSTKTGKKTKKQKNKIS